MGFPSQQNTGFSRLHLIVAIAATGVLVFLAWPMWKSALVKRDLSRTMSNGRELYLAAFRMATDGAAKFDSNRAWPGDYPSSSLAEYCGKLVQNGYLTPADVQRLLSAPGAECTVTMTGSPAALTLSGKPALKLYKVKKSDPSNTIFAVSANYVYATALKPDTNPFGDAGFVVIRKSGDAGVYKKAQAASEGPESGARLQTDIGALPGATLGTVSPGDGAAMLTPPP